MLLLTQKWESSQLWFFDTNCKSYQFRKTSVPIENEYHKICWIVYWRTKRWTSIVSEAYLSAIISVGVRAIHASRRIAHLHHTEIVYGRNVTSKHLLAAKVPTGGFGYTATSFYYFGENMCTHTVVSFDNISGFEVILRLSQHNYGEWNDG